MGINRLLDYRKDGAKSDGEGVTSPNLQQYLSVYGLTEDHVDYKPC